MKRSNLLVLIVFSFFLSCGNEKDPEDSFSSFETARLHPLSYDLPAPDFFEGALLGNGAMGVVVTTRPDAVVLYFGHNNVWDIRLAENDREKVGTFKEVFNKVKAISDTLSLLSEDPWFNEYLKITRESYAKPYPRPFPCGSVLLGFDRRNAEMIGHRLDISNGLCEVIIQVKDQKGLNSGFLLTWIPINSGCNWWMNRVISVIIFLTVSVFLQIPPLLLNFLRRK